MVPIPGDGASGPVANHPVCKTVTTCGQAADSGSKPSMTTSIASMLGRSLIVFTSLAFFSASCAHAASGLCYRGVNLSGAEYGDRNGAADTNYVYPAEATVHYFAGKGMNVIRLPFLWERLQPVLN